MERVDYLPDDRIEAEGAGGAAEEAVFVLKDGKPARLEVPDDTEESEVKNDADYD